jgi:hypothetical protein
MKLHRVDRSLLFSIRVRSDSVSERGLPGDKGCVRAGLYSKKYKTVRQRPPTGGQITTQSELFSPRRFLQHGFL